MEYRGIISELLKERELIDKKIEESKKWYGKKCRIKESSRLPYNKNLTYTILGIRWKSELTGNLYLDVDVSSCEYAKFIGTEITDISQKDLIILDK